MSKSSHCNRDTVVYYVEFMWLILGYGLDMGSISDEDDKIYFDLFMESVRSLMESILNEIGNWEALRMVQVSFSDMA